MKETFHFKTYDRDCSEGLLTYLLTSQHTVGNNVSDWWSKPRWLFWEVVDNF